MGVHSHAGHDVDRCLLVVQFFYGAESAIAETLDSTDSRLSPMIASTSDLTAFPGYGLDGFNGLLGYGIAIIAIVMLVHTFNPVAGVVLWLCRTADKRDYSLAVHQR